MSTGLRSRRNQQAEADILKEVNDLSNSFDESKNRSLTKKVGFEFTYGCGAGIRFREFLDISTG